MKKLLKYIMTFTLLTALLVGCGTNSTPEGNKLDETTEKETSKISTNMPAEPIQEKHKELNESDLVKYQPNESGKIIVAMFHNFIETYDSNQKMSTNTKRYTNTLDAFEDLLQTLYDKGYRLINMNDYLQNNIQIAAGYIPMVFTFDDGTAGQFNLVEENGELVANKRCAVGVMEAFHKKHPDFGLKGTFYVNLGDSVFPGKGTVEERLQYLIQAGFEIGNHTLNHIDLKADGKTKEKVEEQVGGNQKKIAELIPGYKMTSLALPLGNTTQDETLRKSVAKGTYQGTEYENSAIMLVGWDPALPPNRIGYNPLKTPRVRVTGLLNEDGDLDWWLGGKIQLNQQYISDGNPETITVPESKKNLIDTTSLGKKTLRIY